MAQVYATFTSHFGTLFGSARTIEDIRDATTQHKGYAAAALRARASAIEAAPEMSQEEYRKRPIDGDTFARRKFELRSLYGIGTTHVWARMDRDI